MTGPGDFGISSTEKNDVRRKLTRPDSKPPTADQDFKTAHEARIATWLSTEASGGIFSRYASKVLFTNLVILIANVCIQARLNPTVLTPNISRFRSCAINDVQVYTGLRVSFWAVSDFTEGPFPSGSISERAFSRRQIYCDPELHDSGGTGTYVCT